MWPQVLVLCVESNWVTIVSCWSNVQAGRMSGNSVSLGSEIDYVAKFDQPAHSPSMIVGNHVF